MKKIFLLFICISIFSSCSKEGVEEEVKSYNSEFQLKMASLVSKVSSIQRKDAYLLKSTGINEVNPELIKLTEEIRNETIKLYESEGLNILDFFPSKNDYRIALVGIMAYEFDRLPEKMEVQKSTLKATLGECALQAIGVKELYQAGVKKSLRSLLKVAGKQVLKKAIPGVGAAITAGEFIWCMFDD
ncbi:hypothetical protein [Alistipes sp. ZOR0009]|uniref:hypothetical protein n=1 Tax=Alistipes sp. ZOR0009 TaxID=1339253 RepID=UPI0006475CCB|nr:hypothetical protein [Alistipes sp. ZOR0009]